MEPTSTAAQRWANGLAEWAIPPEILAAAPQIPFVFTPSMFAAPQPGPGVRSLASETAAESLKDGGTVLDVGCGGGAAAFALADKATSLIGTDRQADMVELFLTTGAERGLEVSGHTGLWPNIADRVPISDVAVSHNVLYNVPDLIPFSAALHQHARRRVVIEITEFHPQTVRAPLWKQFWNIDRPANPTAWMAAKALSDAGLPVKAERSLATPRNSNQSADVEASFWTRMLCLPQERKHEVALALLEIEFPKERVLIWWDTS